MATKLLDKNHSKSDKKSKKEKKEIDLDVNVDIETSSPSQNPKKKWILAGKILLVLLALSAMVYYTKPILEETIAEHKATSATSKGRVLYRGAQEVVREQMVDGMSHTDVMAYLTNPKNLEYITEISKFEIDPVEITSVKVNSYGQIEEFVCQLHYNNTEFAISLDLVNNTAVATDLTPIDEN